MTRRRIKLSSSPVTLNLGSSKPSMWSSRYASLTLQTTSNSTQMMTTKSSSRSIYGRKGGDIRRRKGSIGTWTRTQSLTSCSMMTRMTQPHLMIKRLPANESGSCIRITRHKNWRRLVSHPKPKPGLCAEGLVIKSSPSRPVMTAERRS